MTNKKLTPRHWLIHPEDHSLKQELTFSLAELKTMQGIVLDRIEQDARETNSEFFTHTELARKLEYYITNQEIKR